MGTLPNREDPDEMSNDASFHPGLHSLLRQNPSSEKVTYHISDEL